MKIKQDSEAASNLLDFKSDSLELYAIAKEVCALGNGNSMIMSLKTPVTVSEDSGLFIVSNGQNRIVRKIECSLYESEKSLASGKVFIKNLDGQISFEQN